LIHVPLNYGCFRLYDSCICFINSTAYIWKSLYLKQIKTRSHLHYIRSNNYILGKVCFRARVYDNKNISKKLQKSLSKCKLYIWLTNTSTLTLFRNENVSIQKWKQAPKSICYWNWATCKWIEQRLWLSFSNERQNHSYQFNFWNIVNVKCIHLAILNQLNLR